MLCYRSLRLVIKIGSKATMWNMTSQLVIKLKHIPEVWDNTPQVLPESEEMIIIESITFSALSVDEAR